MNSASMDAGLIPVRMASAIVTLDQYQPGWSLAEPDSDVPGSIRTFECYVPFDTPFSGPPVVHAGIAGFDIDNRDTARLNVRAEGITAEGFTLSLETWWSTRVYRVDISWLALGSA